MAAPRIKQARIQSALIAEQEQALRIQIKTTKRIDGFRKSKFRERPLAGRIGRELRKDATGFVERKKHRRNAEFSRIRSPDFDRLAARVTIPMHVVHPGECDQSPTQPPPHPMALSVGTKAPDFKLSSKQDDGLKLVSLSEHTANGPVLILFFPMAFTGVCTEELCSVTQGIEQYQKVGATVLAISGDNPFAQEAWAKKESISLTLLSDYEHLTAKSYDVSYDAFLPQFNLGMGGVAKRSAFVIGTDGLIKYAESSDDPKQLPNFAAILAAVTALQ